MTWDKWIKDALEYQDTHTFEDVLERLADGSAQLWYGERSALITEIIEYPRKKVLQEWLCGGDMAELVGPDMLGRAEAFALANGCDSARTGGRKGWNRVMAKHGYSPVAFICEKDLRK